MPTTVTKTVKSSGGDYTSLTGWEAGQQADLTVADQIQQAEVYAFHDTAGVCAINGWTTSSTQYIRVYTPSTERHTGKWDTTKYYLDVTDTDGIEVSEDFTRLEGLQVLVQGYTAGFKGAFVCNNAFGATSDVRTSACIAKGSWNGANYNLHGFLALDDNSRVNWTIWNSVAWHFQNDGDTSSSAIARGFKSGFNTSGGMICYNCTAYLCATGFDSDATKRMKAVNCLSACDQGNSNFVDFTGSFFTGTDFNAAHDATTTGANSRNSQTFTFVDATNGDFHLGSGDTGAKDFGTTDPGSGLFSDDIDGVTRTGSWDIGADEVAAAGGTAVGGPFTLTTLGVQ